MRRLNNDNVLRQIQILYVTYTKTFKRKRKLIYAHTDIISVGVLTCTPHDKQGAHKDYSQLFC